MKTYKILLILLLAVQTIFASQSEILEHVYKTDYGKAFEEAKDDCVLKGIIFATRFDDLGDTLDLDSAMNALVNCKASGLWEPLRIYEIGLIHSIMGNSLKGILEARNAALEFEKLGDIDSKAFFAAYTYYSPFSAFKEKDLKTGYEQSKLFSPIFANTLIWIYYEEKKYAEALEITNALLKKYPAHPVIMQTKADMLFKLGRSNEAIDIYKISEMLYARRAPNSIRYWCAVANLAKMTNDDFWKNKLKSKEYNSIKHRMPF